MKLVEVMHVSPRKVERPRKIAKDGSKATKQVLCKGEISINRAYDTTVAECASKEQSDEIVSEPSREEQFKLAQRFLASKRFLWITRERCRAFCAVSRQAPHSAAPPPLSARS